MTRCAAGASVLFQPVRDRAALGGVGVLSVMLISVP